MHCTAMNIHLVCDEHIAQTVKRNTSVAAKLGRSSRAAVARAPSGTGNTSDHCHESEGRDCIGGAELDTPDVVINDSNHVQSVFPSSVGHDTWHTHNGIQGHVAICSVAADRACKSTDDARCGVNHTDHVVPCVGNVPTVQCINCCYWRGDGRLTEKQLMRTAERCWE